MDPEIPSATAVSGVCVEHPKPSWVHALFAALKCTFYSSWCTLMWYAFAMMEPNEFNNGIYILYIALLLVMHAHNLLSMAATELTFENYITPRINIAPDTTEVTERYVPEDAKKFATKVSSIGLLVNFMYLYLLTLLGPRIGTSEPTISKEFAFVVLLLSIFSDCVRVGVYAALLKARRKVPATHEDGETAEVDAKTEEDLEKGNVECEESLYDEKLPLIFEADNAAHEKHFFDVDLN